VTGAVDLDDQPRHPRQIARAFLDELHPRQFGERDGIGDRNVGARTGIEIEGERQAGLARYFLEIADEIALRRRAGERPQRRQELQRGGAELFGLVRELDRGAERRVRDADHDRQAAVDIVDGGADQPLARLERQVGVFLGLDAGGNHHGGAAVAHHVVDLPPQRRLVDFEIGGERGERRNDQPRLQSRLAHGVPPVCEI
jgi:hypothetical protein